VLVLEGLVALDRWCGPHADGHVELQDGEGSHREPKRESDGVVLIWDVVDSKIVEDSIWNKGPDHVDHECQGGEVPGEESIQLNHRELGLLLFSCNHVDLLKLPLLVLLFKVIAMLCWLALNARISLSSTFSEV